MEVNAPEHVNSGRCAALYACELHAACSIHVEFDPVVPLIEEKTCGKKLLSKRCVLHKKNFWRSRGVV